MSLLVTSCTMGKQPDRLLNKGPQYLRTRTNAGMFGQHRKSAVELLAASKAQFYNITASVSLDNHQDLAVSFGQHERYGQICHRNKPKVPARSKSQYDLSVSHLSTADDENDENNNGSSDDSVILTEVGAFNSISWWSPQDNVVVKHGINSEGPTESASAVVNFLKNHEDASNSITVASVSENIAIDVSTPHPKLTVLRSTSTTLHEHEHIYENITFVNKPAVISDEVDGTGVKKPVPLPRKSKEKPVPSPRKLSVRSALDEKAKDSHTCLSKAVSSPVISHKSLQTNNYPIQETPKLKTQTLSKDPETSPRNKHSLVESLTKRFTALSAASTSRKSEIHNHIRNEDKSTELKDTSGITGTFTATPVYIGRTDTCSLSFQVKRVFICGEHVNSCRTPAVDREPENSNVNSDHVVFNKGRKRCPDTTAPNSVVKKERRSSEFSHSKPGFVNSLVTRFVPVRKSSSTSTSKSEMSIESVDQAVCESDLKAIPAASMESASLREQDELAREVTRSNSSLSGKMDSQDSLAHPLSPTVHCALVPRSYSDIGCCLESQHSRDSSLVSSHSRLSRASVGADLEHFFNQMGLEKGVLEPVSRLRELQASEVFDSISSLDSHDAASICSTYSRSEQEWSDSQSVDRNQQQTSIVERNARIIKWLCNVRKAKGQLSQKLEGAVTGKT